LKIKVRIDAHNNAKPTKRHPDKKREAKKVGYDLESLTLSIFGQHREEMPEFKNREEIVKWLDSL